MFNGLGPPTCGNREIVSCIVAYLMQHKTPSTETPSTCHLSPTKSWGPTLRRPLRDFADRESKIPMVHGIENPEVPNSDISTYMGSNWWGHLPLSGFAKSRIPLSLIPCTGNSRVPNPEIPRSCTTCPVVRSTAPIESGNRYSRFQMVRNAYLHKH